jgi:glycosyltransferase involved in cell wall biosynthesis
MKIMVLPREDTNPYQRLLYGEMRELGVQVSYLGRLTPSRSLNLLLLPAEVAARRLRGARLLHLHWVYAFALPGSDRFPVLRRLAQAWFGVCLGTARLAGVRLVWTAHNVLPHAPVFADDAAARRTLVGACDLVLAHSPAALAGLAALGAVPRRAAVIPHGPFAPALSALPPVALLPAAPLPGAPAPAARPPDASPPGAGGGPRQFLFFGKVAPYKGVEDLLAAFAALPDVLPAGVAARLTIVGGCADPALGAALAAAADACGGRVTLRLERVSDAEATACLSAADAVVLPFREVTTSGSAIQALCHGRPLIVPDLPALADLPAGAVVGYDRTVPGLTAALARLASASVGELAAMSAAATEYAQTLAWPQIAAQTTREMKAVLTGQPVDERETARAG